jgi:hypothetical protein
MRPFPRIYGKDSAGMEGSPMRYTRLPALIAATALVSAVTGLPAAAQANPGMGQFTANLAPLNQDGHGSVQLEQRGTLLTVALRASGLDDGIHVAHIHGIRQAQNECPTLASDADGNGLVDFAEGLPSYGPVQVTLSNGTADRGPALDYTRTYTHLDSGDGIASIGDLSQYAIVVHGVDLNGDGTATNPDVQGDGTDADDHEITMPAVCGTIEGAH